PKRNKTQRTAHLWRFSLAFHPLDQRGVGVAEVCGRSVSWANCCAGLGKVPGSVDSNPEARTALAVWGGHSRENLGSIWTSPFPPPATRGPSSVFPAVRCPRHAAASAS